jgi:TolB protein
MRTYMKLVAPVSVAILAAACTGGQPPGTPASTATAPATQAPTSAVGAPTAARLAFAYDPTGEETSLADGATMPSYEIYLLDADGSNLTRLTDDPGGDLSPAWSPDGRRIASVRASVEDVESGKTFIYVMNADGSGATPVTSGAGNGCDGLYGTSWSPDGQQLAFARGCWDGDAEVWVVNADGTGERHIAGTAGARPTRAALNPVWSPQ